MTMDDVLISLDVIPISLDVILVSLDNTFSLCNIILAASRHVLFTLKLTLFASIPAKTTLFVKNLPVK